MKIIISPAKKMNTETDSLEPTQLPDFINETEEVATYLKGLTYEELKAMWKCSDKIATENYERIQRMDIYRNLTPAILAFEGIQYQYMAPGVFDTEELEYIQQHLRILSGFYGVIRPFDGVVPYRLEMGTKLKKHRLKSLYEFWSDKLASKLTTESDCIVNLASAEYSKSISRHLGQDVKFITCVFGEMVGDKVVEKGTLAKMARGEMVRFMAENKIKNVKDIQGFNYLNYAFSRERSDSNTYTFIKQKEKDFQFIR
jgi:uncharacterized protein